MDHFVHRPVIAFRFFYLVIKVRGRSVDEIGPRLAPKQSPGLLSPCISHLQPTQPQPVVKAFENKKGLRETPRYLIGLSDPKTRFTLSSFVRGVQRILE